MPFTVYETTYSRAVTLSFDKTSARFELFGGMTLDDATARAGFISVLPNPLILTSPVAVMYFESMSVDPLGGGIWKCVANYQSYIPQTQAGQGGVSPPPPPPPAPAATDKLGPEYSWDISNATEHITKSLLTLDKSGTKPDLITTEVAKNHNRAIGVVEKTGEIQGVDRIYPKSEFSVTKVFEFITLSWYKKVHKLVGKVNNATFYQFEAGELLFLGASGQPRDTQGKVAVTFKFAVSFNINTTLTVAPNLTFSAKKGWDYIWVTYNTKVDAGKTVTYANAAYREKIYEDGDFTDLGIGV